MGILNTYRFLARHPMTRNNKLGALRRWLALGATVDARNAAVGRFAGTLTMSCDQDTTNQVLLQDHVHSGNTSEVKQVSLDSELGDASPRLMKIDVEGFESEVLAGAKSTLANPAIEGVILELNGSGARYGFKDSSICETMNSAGFRPFAYEPISRRLRPTGTSMGGGNTLFLRTPDFAQTTVTAARTFSVLGKQI